MGQVSYHNREKEDTKFGKSIGNLAGWDIVRLLINYHEYEGKYYVIGVSIIIQDLKNNTSLDKIEIDIMDKLDIKYGKENKEDIREDNYEYGDYIWRDKNNNSIAVIKGDDNIGIIYRCNDAYEYEEKIGEEFTNKDKVENSKGL